MDVNEEVKFLKKSGVGGGQVGGRVGQSGRM